MTGILGRLALAGALLGSVAIGATGAVAKDLKLIAITHGQASDPFWSIVKNGITQAGKDEAVGVDYRAPETFDMVAMSQLIDAAVNQQPDGLVVSDPDPDALGPSIRKAVAAGIPVISINSGLAAAPKLGIALHIGQDERTAGQAAGAKLKSLGVKHALCVNQEVGNAGLDQRCEGVKDGMQGAPVAVLPTSTDPSETQAKIRAALSSDPSVDGIIGLSAPLVGEPAVEAVASLGLQSKVKVGSFDLSAGFVKDVADGKAAFAVDQQPYLQGYLPMVFLAQHAKNGTLPAGNVATGPSFVTQDNAKQVIEMASKGIR